MNSATLRLVLLVSCAHALVHVYELSLPAAEQQIAGEFFPSDVAAGKQMTGGMSNYWRLMWGLGALAAGWLVDRYGSRPLLAVYLLGCAATCVAAGTSSTQTSLFLSMVTMGALASIYHPAGLALISHETDALSRPGAHGIHGIFGSAGIGSAPLIAGAVFMLGWGWRELYWLLAIPGLLLGLIFIRESQWHRASARHATTTATAAERTAAKADPAPLPAEAARWSSFFVLTLLASTQGFIYSALLSFLPRYLSGVEWTGTWQPLPQASLGNYLAGGALWIGCFGQYLGGRMGRPSRLEWQLAGVMFANAPALAWMAVATDWQRPVAAGSWALVHFMHQPLYNTLVAKYTPPRRRSLCYGFSFAMGLGLGSFGARFAGNNESDLLIYGTLAVVAVVAGCLGVVLWRMNRGA